MVQTVDDGVQVFPCNEFFRRHFIVSRFGKAAEQGLVLCRRGVCYHTDNAELLQEDALEEGIVLSGIG